MHHRAAVAFEGRDWYFAANHFVLAGEPERTWLVINSSIDQILARGDYGKAARLLQSLPMRHSAATEMLRSRLLVQRGDFSAARDAAMKAVKLAQANSPADTALALLNASSVHSLAGDDKRGWALAQRASRVAVGRHQELLALALVGLLETTHEGSIPAFVRILTEMRELEMRRGDLHHLAITNVNLAISANWLHKPEFALDCALTAVEQFSASSQGYEVVSAHLAAAVAFGQLGRWVSAEGEIQAALAQPEEAGAAEAIATAAEIELWYGDPGRAGRYLDEYEFKYERGHPRGSHRHVYLMARAWFALFSGQPDVIRAAVDDLTDVPDGYSDTGGKFAIALTKCRAQTRLGLDASDNLAAARRIASTQESPLQGKLVEMANAIWQGPTALSAAIEAGASNLSLSILGDDIVRSLGQLSEAALEIVNTEARARPWRWRSLLRPRLEEPADGTLQAAQILSSIGTTADVASIRRIAHGNRRLAAAAATMSRDLAQRLAPPVVVHDMGRIRLEVGDRSLAAETVRRKALALLTYLITQPRFSATRDQVADALWPDLAPDLALNSLNQTIYFLRRVFDPKYVAAASAEYIHFEGESVWLDEELVVVDSRSIRNLLRQSGKNLATIDEIIALYDDRFALDFAYEEWAATYRDSLHVSMLAAAEGAVRELSASGQEERAIQVCRRVLELDPER